MVELKGAVVYYSRYGNNEKTAKAVAQGLREAGHEVDLVNAKESGSGVSAYDFLVVGSPTRAGRNSGPVKKFIKKSIGDEWKGKPFAAFGTCMRRACDKGEPTAARDIHAELSKRGLRPLAKPFDNPVSGMKGPLGEEGEKNATQFGIAVGKELSG